MSELQTGRDEESLHPMVWAIVVTHQRQRPDLYAGVHLENRIRELGIVIGEMIACDAYGSQRPENETAEYASSLAAIATGQVTQALLLHLHRLRTGGDLPGQGGRKPS
jgi:hypothetical protein